MKPLSFSTRITVIMDTDEHYTNNDILNLFYIHGECQRIIERTCRTFNERYPHLPSINSKKFKRITSNFLRYGRINGNKRNRLKPVTNEDANEINVLSYFNAYPNSSIAAASVDLGLSKGSIHRILKKHKMHPYSFLFLQALHPGDADRRIAFCEFMLTKIQEDESFLKKIIWTDESKFSREGVINRKNLHYWAQENPHVVREAHFQHSFAVNVFVMVKYNQLRFHIYEENLNTNRYLQILEEIVTPFLDDLPLNEFRECWFQLDGAPAHSSWLVNQQLTNIFDDRWIGPNGPWKWPPRSPDLTPLDYFLWGYVKSQVYSRPLESRQELINRIRACLTNINGEIIITATTSEFQKRIMRCLANNGQHMEHNL